MQYFILREKGTEAPGSGKLLHNFLEGTYACVGCKTVIFKSQDKFDHGTGWPSFNRPISPDVVKLQEDRSHNLHRVEVLCSKCGGHLGHVFHDAPDQPTGMNFCINSEALIFEEHNKR